MVLGSGLRLGLGWVLHAASVPSALSAADGRAACRAADEDPEEEPARSAALRGLSTRLPAPASGDEASGDDASGEEASGEAGVRR